MYEDNTGTLYVIGNGFDCCHGLDTGTNRFLEILRTKEIYNETETAESVFRRYNVGWGDYEKCLADIDMELIEEEQLMAPDYFSDHEYDRDGVIYNMEQYTESLHKAIQESLEEMVDDANCKLMHERPVLIDFLNHNDAVLNFNYTSTLEELYDVPSTVHVCHIHGFRANGERLLLGFREGMSAEEYFNHFYDEKIVEEIQSKIKEIQEDETLSEKEKANDLLYWYTCYDDAIGDGDFYINMQREAIFGFYQSLKKEIQIDKLKRFLKECKGIKRVIVMGHSMSDVDSEYMELIEEELSPYEWRISQFNNSPSIECIREYSFADKVKFYDLNDEYTR